MVKKITKEEVTLEYPGYGKITIPAGVEVFYDRNLPEEERLFHVNDRQWIDEKYPQFADKLFSDMQTAKMYVPADNLIHVIRLKFAFDESGYCRDYFKTDEGVLVCRMESHENHAQWYTVTQDYLEPLFPFRTNMLIQVLDVSGNIVMTEQQEKTDYGYISLMKFPFSWQKPENGEEEKLCSRIYNLRYEED